MEPILEVKNLVKIYKPKKKKEVVVANDGISFSVGQGECVGILGPNGSGKTTLIRQIIGYLPQTSGTIKISGKENTHKEVRHLIGYMMQNRYSHWDYLTVTQALNFAGKLKKLSNTQIKNEGEELIEKFELDAYRNKMIKYLSGGNRQAVSLSITLIGKPQLIILDEPSTGLDPIKRTKFWKLLNDINQKNSSAILLISHNPLEIEKVAHNVIMLNAGKIIINGSLKELRNRLIGESRIEISINNQKTMESIIENFKDYKIIREKDKLLFYTKHTLITTIIENIKKAVGWEDINDFTIINPNLEDLYIKMLEKKLE
ncbi:MAG: ABC transporter ATP-binding protein [Spirochaetales bacterium]|nr:ABC transporter ATP-binding protein [Spirochaetales bacterium]